MIHVLFTDAAALCVILAFGIMVGVGLYRTATAGFMALGMGALGAATLLHILLSVISHRVLLQLVVLSNQKIQQQDYTTGMDFIAGPYVYSMLLSLSQPTMFGICMTAIILVLIKSAETACHLCVDLLALLESFAIYNVRRKERSE